MILHNHVPRESQSGLPMQTTEIIPISSCPRLAAIRLDLSTTTIWWNKFDLEASTLVET